MLSTFSLCPPHVKKKKKCLRRNIQIPRELRMAVVPSEPKPRTLARARGWAPGSCPAPSKTDVSQEATKKGSLRGDLGSASPAGPLPSLCGVGGCVV